MRLLWKWDIQLNLKIYVRIYIKGYGFLSFAKNMGTHICNKFGQKLLDSSKKCTTGARKTPSKRENQKTAETYGDLIGNKIADKITSVSRKSSKKSHSEELHSQKIEDAIETPKERWISPEKKTTN